MTNMTKPRKVTNLVLRTPNDFYEFFASIPKEKWTTGFPHNNGQSCALGQLGLTRDYSYPTRQCKRNVIRLGTIFAGKRVNKDSAELEIYSVNDGTDAHPKTNMLRALDKISKK